MLAAPLTPAEHAKLEAILEPARQELIDTTGATAWLEGWDMPVEKTIDEVLLREGAAPRRSARSRSRRVCAF